VEKRGGGYSGGRTIRHESISGARKNIVYGITEEGRNLSENQHNLSLAKKGGKPARSRTRRGPGGEKNVQLRCFKGCGRFGGKKVEPGR